MPLKIVKSHTMISQESFVKRKLTAKKKKQCSTILLQKVASR